MAVEPNDIAEAQTIAPTRSRERFIGVFIATLAVILAICAMGGDNAAKEATLKNIEVSNTWAFYQAKRLRQQIVRGQIENFELTIISTPGLDPAAKRALEKSIATYRAYEARLESEPETGDGMNELKAKARSLKEEIDRALKQDPYFDYGQALLQIAIVVASVAIISGGSALIVLSAILGLAGTAMMLNGFLLLVDIPYLG